MVPKARKTGSSMAGLGIRLWANTNFTDRTYNSTPPATNEANDALVACQ